MGFNPLSTNNQIPAGRQEQKKENEIIFYKKVFFLKYFSNFALPIH
jgi:hypothetical protein